MHWKLQKAIDDALILEYQEFLKEYEFLIHHEDSHLMFRYRVRLFKQYDRGGIWFAQSHYIKAPGHGEYRTSKSWGDNEDEAIGYAIDAVLVQYREALAAGHMPFLK